MISQRPEVRALTTSMINEEIRRDWSNLIGMVNSNLPYMTYMRKYHMNFTENFLFRLKKRLMLKQKGVYSVQLSFFHNPLIAISLFSRWKAFTAKKMLLDGNRVPLLRLLNNKKFSIADVYCDMFRIKSSKLSDGILYPYCRDICIVIFHCIFLGFSLWIFLAPEPLLHYLNSIYSYEEWFSPTLCKLIKGTYVNHICLSHPEVLSPCECGEPLNKIVMESYPLKNFDPLKIDNSAKLLTSSLMVGTMILSLLLTESVFESGLFLPL